MTATSNVIIVDNPHAQWALKQMRNRDLPTVEFRRHSDEAALCLANRVSGDYNQYHSNVVIVPILRAGLALEPQFMKKFPGCSVHHIGLERDEKTFMPKSYYPRRGMRVIPPDVLTIVTDPMNATAGSGSFTLQALMKAGAGKTIFVNVISSEEGVARIQSEFPDVVIYTLAVDPELDANKYIVPGLGDYGDRYFGTF
jgi:uracil phosphoribosyltransferase